MTIVRFVVESKIVLLFLRILLLQLKTMVKLIFGIFVILLLNLSGLYFIQLQTIKPIPFFLCQSSYSFLPVKIMPFGFGIFEKASLHHHLRILNNFTVIILLLRQMRYIAPFVILLSFLNLPLLLLVKVMPLLLFIIFHHPNLVISFLIYRLMLLPLLLLLLLLSLLLLLFPMLHSSADSKYNIFLSLLLSFLNLPFIAAGHWWSRLCLYYSLSSLFSSFTC
mmetsp:Transcript_1707/g.2254  ORF Transcript_1707/g.2254 Transcript_1707/m.2254 type:complete len:222 (+) Transcript_1707:351-1016(+)